MDLRNCKSLLIIGSNPATISFANYFIQNTNTNLMIYDCFTLIEYLSTAFTLYPGDLIPTGTPEGSALATQNWLVPGDKVKVEIDGIGFIENKIVQEPDTTKTLF